MNLANKYRFSFENSLRKMHFMVPVNVLYKPKFIFKSFTGSIKIELECLKQEKQEQIHLTMFLLQEHIIVRAEIMF